MITLPITLSRQDVLMRVFLFTLTTVGALACCVGQGTSSKLRLPIWTFHQPNTTTIGLNLGVASTLPDSARNVTTFGIRAEVTGVGLLLFMAPAVSAISREQFEAQEALPFRNAFMAFPFHLWAASAMAH